MIAESALVNDEPRLPPSLSSSRFRDRVWRIDHEEYVVQKPSARNIDWAFPFADGSDLCDLRHSDWLEVTRRAVLAYMTGLFGLEPGPQSVLRMCQGLRQFVVWLQARGECSYAALSPECVAMYREHLANRQSRKRDKRLAGGTIAGLLLPIQALAIYLASCDDRIADQLAEIVAAADWRDRSPESPTARIPDEYALPLLQAAIRLIRDDGPALLKHFEVVARFGKASRAARVSDRSRTAHRNRRKAATADPCYITVGTSLVALDTINGNELQRHVRRLETACFIVISGLTGMRVSSIGALKDDCLSTRSLGSNSLLFLRGLLFKRRPRHVEWDFLAGWDNRADGTNPVRSAVETLAALRAARKSASPYLFLGPGSLYAGTEAPLSSVALNRRLNSFARIEGLEGWRFASHQFRRTFARFVTKRDFGALVDLQRHFGQLSIQVTAGYAQWDSDLLQDIIAERFEQDLEAIDEVLRSDQLAGALGGEILSRNTAFRGAGGAVMRAEYLDVLRRTQAIEPLLMIRHRYGYCIYVPELAMCGGDAAKIGLGTCLNCRNLIVGPSHVPFWFDHVSALREQRSLPTYARLPATVRAEFDSLVAQAEQLLDALSVAAP